MRASPSLSGGPAGKPGGKADSPLRLGRLAFPHAVIMNAAFAYALVAAEADVRGKRGNA